MIEVVKLTESLYERYTSYLVKRTDARFGHDLAWADVLHDIYGTETEHLVALDGEQVVGVCPFFLCKPLFGGAHYVTNPFPTYCGPLGDSVEVINALLQAVCEKTSSVDHAEVLVPARLLNVETALLPFEERLDYTHRLPLKNGIDEVFNSFSRDNKRILKKTDALSDLEIIVDTDGRYIDQFHKLYVSVYAGKHGFIPHSKKLFVNIFKHYQNGSARIYLSRYKGRYTGAMFTFWVHREVYYGWSAVVPDSTYHPTHFLLWKIIQDAHAERFHWFNMGEAARDHHGLNHFKRGWGTEIIEPHRYFIPGSQTMPTPRLFDRISWAKKIIAGLPSGVVNTFLSPAIRYFL